MNKSVLKQCSGDGAGPLAERPGLSLRGQAYHREAFPVTERPGLSQKGLDSYREAGPLTDRPDLS